MFTEEIKSIKTVPPEEIERRRNDALDRFGNGEITQQQLEAELKKIDRMATVHGRLVVAASGGANTTAQAVVIEVLMRNADRFPYDDLIPEAAKMLVSMEPNVSDESAEIKVSNAIHELFANFRITREEGIVYLQSDREMLANQVWQLFISKEQMTWEEIAAGMKRLHGTENEDALLDAVSYLWEDEGTLAKTDTGFRLVKEEERQSESGIIPADFPAPGSKPVSEVMGDLPTVDVDVERDRLIDEFAEGVITQTELDQKLRRLQASAEAAS